MENSENTNSDPHSEHNLDHSKEHSAHSEQKHIHHAKPLEHSGRPIIETLPPKKMAKDKKAMLNFWLDILLNIVIIIALVFIIRTYFISPFQVYGPSMCDTLNFIDNKCQHAYGEYIIVNKLGYQNFFGWQVGLPKRGDIIVFHPPHNPSEFFIKRVIGLPGETIRLENGQVKIINQENPKGITLNEPYLNATNHDNTIPIGEISVFEVPQGEYFVLGDNRVASSDSRTCFKESPGGGKCGEGEVTPFLPLGNIEGKASIVMWPLSKTALLHDPAY